MNGDTDISRYIIQNADVNATESSINQRSIVADKSSIDVSTAINEGEKEIPIESTGSFLQYDTERVLLCRRYKLYKKKAKDS